MIDMGDGEEYLKRTAERARKLGITEGDFAAARNPGDRRTPEKQELLRRIATRSCAAGISPLPAKY